MDRELLLEPLKFYVTTLWYSFHENKERNVLFFPMSRKIFNDREMKVFSFHRLFSLQWKKPVNLILINNPLCNPCKIYVWNSWITKITTRKSLNAIPRSLIYRIWSVQASPDKSWDLCNRPEVFLSHAIILSSSG